MTCARVRIYTDYMSCERVRGYKGFRRGGAENPFDFLTHPSRNYAGAPGLYK